MGIIAKRILMFTTKKILLTSTLILSSLLAMEKPLVLPDVLKPHKPTTQSTALHTTFTRKGPTVQIGILLDTSGSMNGLINQAKDQLWKIVNEVAKANKNNKSVTIQVGLFEYGKASLPKYEGYLQMLSPLTSDLDNVSESLFSLRTNGGDEYAGKVILESVNRFAWSSHPDDLKLLIIAGNESFAQGTVPYERAIEKAKNNNIIVNTIFCGQAKRGKQLFWDKGAKLGGGKAFNINHNDRRVYMQTPYDDDIITLGKNLNATYLNYGHTKERRKKTANIYKQDRNSFSMSKTSYIERNLVKAKKQYSQASSDMVTAFIEDETALSKISKEKLPDALKDKSPKEIQAIVQAKKTQRIALQEKIKVLETQRESFIAKNTPKDKQDLASAIIKSIKEQAKSNGFVFGK